MLQQNESLKPYPKRKKPCANVYTENDDIYVNYPETGSKLMVSKGLGRGKRRTDNDF